MISLFDKEVIKEDDIRDLINIGAEESIILEFKSSGSLENNDKKKSEIAKDVSAFANSAGGVIIYGVNEKNHKAESLSPIDGNLYTKEWLEHVIQSRIQRKIEGLKIIPIRLNGKVQQSLYVVNIPESSLAPHMTSDKKYYKRYNFESVQMEEYEIRNLYNRKEKTYLIIENICTSGEIESEPIDNDNITYVKLSFQIQNIGKAVEKDYKLLINMNFSDFSASFDPLKDHKNYSFSLINKSQTELSFFSISPIFPDEVLTIGKLKFGILDSKLNDIIKKGIFNLKLLYTNGKTEISIPLKDINWFASMIDH